ncbi:MAG TPA: histidine kinase [Bacilli bacterium]
MIKNLFFFSRFPFRSFQFRLLIYLLLFGSLTLGCFIAVSIWQSSHIAQSEMENYVHKTHKQTIERIEQGIKQLRFITDHLNGDFVIQQYMNSPEELYDVMTMNELKQYFDNIMESNKKSSSYITELCLSFEDNHTDICPNSGVLSADTEYPVSPKVPVLSLVNMENGSNPALKYTAPLMVQGSNAVKGYVVIVYDFNQMLKDNDRINPVHNYNIMDNQGNLIYTGTGARIPLPITGIKQQEYTQTQGNSMINQRSLTLLNKQWLSLIEVNSGLFTAPWKSLQTTLVLFFIMFFFLSILSSILFSRFITKPLNHLKGLMKRAELGDLKAYWTMTSTQEIHELGESFNQMLNRIEDLIKQVKTEEALKKEAEIEALQYQLNPHFLYNTLNTIKWVAKIHKTPQISEVVSSLVRLLQVSLGKKGDFLTLRDEILLIKDYMEIQAFRYGDQVKMVYDIDAVANMCLVPRMILQPLVENALIHGIEPSERKGLITIKAWIDRDLLMCQVEDNGSGISEKAGHLDFAKNKGLQEKMSGIGLKHIREKIKLYYGPDYKLLIIPKEKQGTIVRMSLPIHPSEE